MIAEKYRIERVLGVGGMGVVAEATHLELQQRVALKFMLPRAMSSPTAADRFLREARAAVQLRSDHICRVLDVGRHEGGAPYIVMELLEGEDLMALLLRSGALPVERACGIVMQLLEGLADAHASSIIHRDLKPQNVFVTKRRDGRPLIKILDFGISKSGLGGNTQTSDIMGSPAYMSPEQMQSSKHVDARADIWSVGVILHQICSGQLPFEGESLPALCVAVLQDAAPRLDELNPAIPAAFASVVSRCLEKDPNARFGNVAELARALGPFATGDAREAPERIAQIIGVQGTSEAALAPTQIATAPARARSTPGIVTTLERGAGEIPLAQAPRRRNARGVLLAAGAAALLVAGGVFIGTRRSAPPATPAPSASSQLPATSPTADAALVLDKPSIDAGVVPADASVADAPPAATLKRTVVKHTSTEHKAIVTPPVTTPPVTTPPVATPAAGSGSAQQKTESKWTKMQHDK